MRRFDAATGAPEGLLECLKGSGPINIPRFIRAMPDKVYDACVTLQPKNGCVINEYDANPKDFQRTPLQGRTPYTPPRTPVTPLSRRR